MEWWEPILGAIWLYGVFLLIRSLYRWILSLFGLPKVQREQYRRFGRQEREWGWLSQDRWIPRQWGRFYWEGYHEADHPSPEPDPLESRP